VALVTEAYHLVDPDAAWIREFSQKPEEDAPVCLLPEDAYDAFIKHYGKLFLYSAAA
jgi:hypothetical protein